MPTVNIKVKKLPVKKAVVAAPAKVRPIKPKKKPQHQFAALFIVATTALALTSIILQNTMALDKKLANIKDKKTVSSMVVEPVVVELETVQVQWEAKSKIDNMDLVQIDTAVLSDAATSAVGYYQVGEITDGTFAGGTVINVMVPPTGAGISDNGGYTILRFIAYQGEFYALPKYSGTLDPSSGYSLNTTKIKADSQVLIVGLDLPDTLSADSKNARQKLSKMTSVKTTDWFNATGKSVVFKDAALGDVYVKNNVEEYFVALPDGTSAMYALASEGGVGIQDDFGNGGIIEGAITWNDNTTNTNGYIIDAGNECRTGTTFQRHIKISTITGDILKAVGNNAEQDVIYELKNTATSTVLKDLYNNINGETAGTKITYAQFVEMHPLLFWTDPFGRQMRFLNSALLEVCGG